MTPQYVAGLLDGEGCITITTNGPKGYKSYLAQVIVSMTHEGVIQALHEKYGGPPPIRYDPPERRFRTIYRWHLSGHKSQALLEEVSPYLITKKRQAGLVTEFLKEYCRWAGNFLSLDEASRRSELVEELRRLNRRGRIPEEEVPRESPQDFGSLSSEYAAGIIDGEGTISIYVCASGRFTQYTGVMSVTMSCRSTVEALRASFGGVPLRIRSTPSRNHKDTYLWRVNGQKVLPLLKSFSPFLIVKREQAELVIEFLERCSPGHFGKLDPSLQQRREEIVSRLRDLNRKGRKE